MLARLNAAQRGVVVPALRRRYGVGVGGARARHRSRRAVPVLQMEVQ